MGNCSLTYFHPLPLIARDSSLPPSIPASLPGVCSSTPWGEMAFPDCREAGGNALQGHLGPGVLLPLLGEEEALLTEFSYRNRKANGFKMFCEIQGIGWL